MIRVGVYGASGYTGLELLRILHRHPQVQLVFATAQSHAGSSLRDVFPVPWDIPLIAEAEADCSAVDAVFCCLPAGKAMETIALAYHHHVRAIDLSADFRLADAQLYTQWYGIHHSAPDLLPLAVYGLPELYREQIKHALIVANPGCYPTSVLLALYPLLKEQLLLSDRPIIVDSKSGVSGAGRSPTLKTHFVEANENLSPYNVGRKHRHLPEMEQEIVRLGGPFGRLIFTPHLLPVNRGILSTIYVSVSETISIETLYDLFCHVYAEEPFIWILSPGQLATLAHAVHTNRCVLSIIQPMPGQLIICSAIDNLIKGAAGQAVQNFNLMFGLDETTGLVML
ncbi:MAG: N-acetyl-gamma-glutamyl-phosphate reductase [Anaerolineae bacterium]